MLKFLKDNPEYRLLKKCINMHFFTGWAYAKKNRLFFFAFNYDAEKCIFMQFRHA